mmetsp:Transcript_457/g.946  ORF Transcript_457/g.946 Transcript_457/m.946 type:complete len:235 (-) Transcript_457:1255-1959(-)
MHRASTAAAAWGALTSCLWCGGSEVAHHGAELVVLDGAAVVLVHLLDDVLDALVRDAKLLERLHELCVRDVPVLVNVKVLEGGLEVLLALQLAVVDGGRQELLVVNGAAAVHVGLGNQALHLLLGEAVALAAQSLGKLLHRDAAALVLVHVLEDLLHAADLIHGQAGGNDLERLLLEPVHGAEPLHAGQHLHLKLVVGRHAVLAHPVVLQDLLGGGAALGVTHKHAAHTVLGGL